MSEAATKQEVTTVQTGHQLTPMDMLNIAVERGADIDQLQKLMDLNDRWEATQARKAFQAAMGKFKKSPPEIIKDKEINHGGRLIAKYADLAQVSKKIIDGLNKVGVTHRWESQQSDDARVIVTCIITHEAGHSESNTLWAFPDDSGSKNKVQAIASTVTYLQRYTLLAVCGLAVEGQDDDAQAAAPMKVPAPKGTSDEFENKDGTLAISKLKDAARKLGPEIESCEDGDQLIAFLNTPAAQEVMTLTEKFMASWWYGNADSRGLKTLIDGKKHELGVGK